MQKKSRRSMTYLLGSLGLVAAMTATGCQVDIGGQIHPSPYYLGDDVQYFAPGSEMKLSNEAAQLKAYDADSESPDGL